MKLEDFDLWVRKHLDLEETASLDDSLNGLQVGRKEADITRAAFAVDACLDTFRRAKEEGAQILFVHHGLFWGKPGPLTGVMRERVKFLMENDLALYGVHLPLDKDPRLGNNILMAQALDMEECLPFGLIKNMKIGYKGKLKEPLTMEEIVKKLHGSWEPRVNILPFGPQKNRKVGMVSGGAPWQVMDAVEEKLDAFITGDASHSIFHYAKEAGINVLFGGHYLTEVYGVQAVAQRVKEELSLETIFIDVPTGY